MSQTLLEPVVEAAVAAPSAPPVRRRRAGTWIVAIAVTAVLATASVVVSNGVDVPPLANPLTGEVIPTGPTSVTSTNPHTGDVSPAGPASVTSTNPYTGGEGDGGPTAITSTNPHVFPR